jgi:hypothetical protein
VLTRGRLRAVTRPASPDDAAISAGAGRQLGPHLIAAMLIAASALDLARCSLVVMATRHHASAAWLIAAGIGAAAASMTAARACGAGRRWAGWAALVIGIGSEPQASVSGFYTPYAIPDVATAALGILLTVTVLATAGRAREAAEQPRNLCDTSPAADAGLSARSSSVPSPAQPGVRA